MNCENLSTTAKAREKKKKRSLDCKIPSMKRDRTLQNEKLGNISTSLT